MKYGPALDSADRAFICGLTRNWRPPGLPGHVHGPPTADGGRRHVHQLLVPKDGGSNVRRPTRQYGILAARQCLGRLIAHEAIGVMSAPTVSNYKRLIPGIIAGYWANWGLDNRMSTYRVPGGSNATIENRMPCGTATRTSPPVMLNAALPVWSTGLVRQPQAAMATARRTPTATPHTCDAVAAFEADSVLCEAMGADLTCVPGAAAARWRWEHGSDSHRRDHRLGVHRVPALLLSPARAGGPEPSRGRQGYAVQFDIVAAQVSEVVGSGSTVRSPARRGGFTDVPLGGNPGCGDAAMAVVLERHGCPGDSAETLEPELQSGSHLLADAAPTNSAQPEPVSNVRRRELRRAETSADHSPSATASSMPMPPG